MHPKEDGSETKIEGGFYSKSPFARFCVLFAGPLFSIVFGVLVLAGSLSITGERQPLTDPVIGHLDEKGPGYLAGLREGDRFLTVNGEPVAVFFDVLKQVRKSHETKDGTEVAVPLTLTIERGLDTKTIVVLPKKDIEPTPVLDEKLQETKVAKIQFKLGISPSLHNVPLPFGQAIAKAAMQPIEMVKGLAETFSKPAKIADNLGGPVSIAREMGAASKEGTSTVVTLAGLLSISLGVMNLLPIVPFDGGQIVVAIAEMFRGGKRLSLQLQSILSTVGVFLIFILMMTVVTIDISHTVGK